MVLCLHIRRFVCADPSCGRRTFAEQIPGLTRRYSRWTERLRSALAEVGLALAGRAGARIADVFGIAVSRSTVLRLVDALPEPQPRTPRVVGVDEYAMRKGTWYEVLRVNPKSVTIPHIHNGTGEYVVRAPDNRLFGWTWTAPYDDVSGRMSADEMQQKAPTDAA